MKTTKIDIKMIIIDPDDGEEKPTKIQHTKQYFCAHIGVRKSNNDFTSISIGFSKKNENVQLLFIYTNCCSRYETE